MKNIAKMSFSLFIVCVAAGGLLSLVNRATEDRISENALRENRQALTIMFSKATDFREMVKDARWDVYNGDERVGTVIKTAAQGYSGRIIIMFGLDTQNRITGVKILSHSETPGLGAKITLASYLDQFKNKKSEELYLKSETPSGTIDAITAATISSRAVTNQVRSEVESFAEGEVR